MAFSREVCVSIRELARISYDLVLLSMGHGIRFPAGSFGSSFTQSVSTAPPPPRHVGIGIHLQSLCLTVAKTALSHVSWAVCISGPHASPAPPLCSAQSDHFLRGLPVYCMLPHTLKKKKKQIDSFSVVILARETDNGAW